MTAAPPAKWNLRRPAGGPPGAAASSAAILAIVLTLLALLAGGAAPARAAPLPAGGVPGTGGTPGEVENAPGAPGAPGPAPAVPGGPEAAGPGAAAAAPAAPAAPPEMAAAARAKRWVLMPEPTFMRHEIAWQILGAERTVIAPGWVVDDRDLEFPSRATWETLGATADGVRQAAVADASRVYKTLKPQYTRNKADVVEYGVFRGDHPLVATIVVAPEFARDLEPVFGPRFLAVIPNRFTVFMFPRLAGNHLDYAPMVRDAYQATPYPVSLELFEVAEQGLQAIAIFEDQPALPATAPPAPAEPAEPPPSP